MPQLEDNHYHDYYTIIDDDDDAFKEDINSDLDFPLYEEIHGIDTRTKVMEPFPILRPECQILKADDDSMIPRPKLGWRNRKVTFEIADNASLSVEETGSSATESTDSIGSLRNSSPENAEKCVMREINRSSDAMSRLSPMVTGNATSLKLQKQILSYSAEKHKDLGYHTLMNTCSTSSLESSDNLWDVRATKTPIRDLKLMTHNAKHSPVSRSSTPRSVKMLSQKDRTNSFA